MTCKLFGGKCDCSEIDRVVEKYRPVFENANWSRPLLRAALLEYRDIPVPMLLYCPACLAQHVDAPEPETGWTNPPHATHTCKACGLNWRPSNHNTVGVASIECLEPKHAERIAAALPTPPSACLEPDIDAERYRALIAQNCVMMPRVVPWDAPGITEGFNTPEDITAAVDHARQSMEGK